MSARLFDPLTLRSLTVRNRVWLSPMCQYSAVEGVPDDWHLVHLGARATGGFGLVLTEAAAVTPEGRISPQDAGIWNDEQARAWRRVFDFVHSQGAATGVQLAHAGRKASTYRPWAEKSGTVPLERGGWTTSAPSAVAFEGYDGPAAMSLDEIAAVVTAFADAGRRAVDAGADTVEIHAAHGYLLHEFLSPLSNRREDHYGGSFENRTRLLLETVDAVRAALPDGAPPCWCGSRAPTGSRAAGTSSRAPAWVVCCARTASTSWTSPRVATRRPRSRSGRATRFRWQRESVRPGSPPGRSG